MDDYRQLLPQYLLIPDRLSAILILALAKLMGGLENKVYSSTTLMLPSQMGSVSSGSSSISDQVRPESLEKALPRQLQPRWQISHS